MTNDRDDDIGPTGRYPDDKLNPSDEGELRVKIDLVDGRVVIVFGKPVNWVGLLPHQAEDLAVALLTKAREATR